MELKKETEMSEIISVQGTEISIIVREKEEYISLTDIPKYRNKDEPFSIINNWMRSRSTIEFLGLWEKLSNPDFKPIEFERFRNDAGSNYFVLSPQRWIESTHATGIKSKSWKIGGPLCVRSGQNRLRVTVVRHEMDPPKFIPCNFKPKVLN
jgi:hypothetical protein